MSSVFGFHSCYDIQINAGMCNLKRGLESASARVTKAVGKKKVLSEVSHGKVE